MRKRGLIILIALLVMLIAIAPSVALITGDVSGNNEVTSADAAIILRHVVRLNTLTEEQLKAGDVNFDGSTDSADASLILRYIVRLEGEFVQPTPTIDPTKAYLMSTAPQTGDRVVIFCEAYQMALDTCESTATYYNAGVEMTPYDGVLSGVTSNIVWDVTLNPDGSYYFTQGGKRLSMDTSRYSTPFDKVHDKWSLEATDGGYYINNVGRVTSDTDTPYKLEWYDNSGYFTGYHTIEEGYEDAFSMSFYLQTGSFASPTPTSSTQTPTPLTPTPTPRPTSNPDAHSLDIYLIDVGFGDSILIVSPNDKTMLIDSSNCGTNDKGVSAKTQMKNLFSELNIDSFDLGVYTHAHSDHVNGYLNFLFDDYTFDAFIGTGLINNPDSSTYQSITAKLSEQTFPTYYVTTESNTDKFSLWDSDVDIEVLWPVPNYTAYDTNDTSLVLKMSYAGYSIMLTGDATSNVESQLIQRHGVEKLNCDIYKVAHHTSNGSSSSNFLSALSPDWAVASFTSNAYNWPGASTVERLSAAGLSWSSASNPSGKLFGTSYHGNIHISIDTDGTTITTEYAG